MKAAELQQALRESNHQIYVALLLFKYIASMKDFQKYNLHNRLRIVDYNEIVKEFQITAAVS